MICKNLMTKTFLFGLVFGSILSAMIITGCTVDSGPEDARGPDRATVSTVTTDRGANDSGREHSSKRESNESGEERGKENGEHSSGYVERNTDVDDGTISPGISEREDGDSVAEHGDREEGSGGERSKSGGEVSETGSGEVNEAAMSSPIIPLGQSWSGVLGGLAVSMQYDAATQSVYGTVRNTLRQKLCYVQSEPHLKSGTKTVGELGPDKLGDLNPGQEATSSLSVAGEPNLAGVSYDGYVVHLEVFGCTGPGPVSHTGGEGAEGSGAEGSESGGEHGSDGELRGGGGEEGSANMLASDETFDMVRSGARLILKYDAPSNSFIGTVENMTNGVLTRVRIEVHLSNGAELGPTTPQDMGPGEVVAIILPATQASFTGWVAHAEVGGGDEGSESDREHGGSSGERGEGSESGGERGDGSEHGGGENGDEHGRRSGGQGQ